MAKQALTAAAVEFREAGESDAVAGVRPKWVATADGTESAAAVLRVAAEHDLSVVPRGSGSKLDWGAAPREVDLVLDVSAASGIVEHAAGDLVVHAKAGTPLAEVRQAVSAAGQQLAIDQPLPTATVGGVIATATSGPCRHLFGGVRDLLIGITVVRPDGAVTISGGKVVKNVAGYDLGKLYTGSFGTLGVITEAVFRLHPQAAEHRWITVRADDPDAAAQAVDHVRHSQAMPSAIELDRPGPGSPFEVTAQIEGMPNATHERALELAAEIGGTVAEQPPEWWGRYPAAGTGLRLGIEPKALAALLTALHDTDVALRGAAGIGVLHAEVPESTDPAAVADLVGDLRARCDYAVLLQAPQEVRAVVDPWGPIDPGVLTLMRRTKDQFDPGHRLAPGRFVGGI